MSTTTHCCPAPGCNEDVPSRMFACRAHWYAIPKNLRDELWAAYLNDGQLSERHVAAMEACTSYLEERFAPQGG